ncbi:MAG: hypothetical protein FJ280_08090 [Planctomycetes bacterium]|nr:hypothetical protein [Planctomycetota bacterium]
MKATRNTLILVWVLAATCGLPNVKAEFTFGKPVNIGPIVGGDEFVVCLSYDGLEMYVQVWDWPGGQGDWDFWVLRRTAIGQPWGTPENLGPAVNSPNRDGAASISADGLTFYFFSSNRPGGYGNNDIYMATRATKNDPWGEAVLLGPPINRISSAANDGRPWISPDGLELYFVSRRSGGSGEGDIWVSRRATENDPWGTPVNLGPGVNTSYEDVFPCLSPDGLLLFFCDAPTSWAKEPRPGGYGACDMWMARRASVSDPWQAPVNLGPTVNNSADGAVPRISPDGRTLYFWSNQGGFASPNWQAPIIPIVDFNGDGKVDGKEVLGLVEHWGEDYPLGDIGPFAWGDGTVDVNDLKVLAEYLGKDVEDPTLVAHWAFDETEGTVAKNSAGGQDAALVGSPVWQPAGGQVGGALAFDGIKDFGFATVTLNPLGRPFSALAWVKGGAPGEVVLAEQNGRNWLLVDSATGCLATALNSPGRPGAVLTSLAVITDGQWHRIAVVWDGTYRMLYVDEKEVARDVLPVLELSSVRLALGGGSNLAPVSFWSGVIDDIRIYNRAVKP